MCTLLRQRCTTMQSPRWLLRADRNGRVCQMKSIASIVALVMLAASPALAQDYSFPRNPNIAVEYGVPKNDALKGTADRMQKLNVLQTLQEFLSPLKLKTPIKVRMDQCGALSIPYKQQGPVTIC